MFETGLPAADYIVVFLYLAAVLAAGFWFARLTKTGKDFFVGGNRIPWWAAGVSLYMTTFSAWMFTGAASFVYNTGWFGFLYLAVKPVGFAIGFLISAVRWRRSRITSPVEFVEERYNHTTRLVLSFVLVLSMMYWPGHHLASVAKISAPALFPGIPWAIDALILFFGLFVLLYTIAGGIWAVSITDVLQFLVLGSVCVILLVAIGFHADEISLTSMLASVPKLEFEHTVREGTVYTHWYLVGLIASGLFGNVVGDKAQRFFMVRDEKAAMKVGWLAFILFLTSPLLFGIPPLIGKVLWPNPEMLASFAGLSKPDETIFIVVVMKYLPAGLVGLFLAAMMAASMSALDSVWNTVSAIVSVDLYKGHLRPNASDKELLWVGRVTVLALCLIAVAMALVITHSSLGIFTFSNIVLGLVAIPVTIPLLVGLISRYPSSWSAIPSILGGIAVASVTRFNLDWTLGPQYLAVISTGLLLLFASSPTGKMYARSALLGWITSLGIGLAVWLMLSLWEAPTMQTGIYRSGFGQSWVLISSLFVAILNAGFAPLYAREARNPSKRVAEFFARLDSPIDVEKELVGEKVNARPGRIVAFTAFGLAIVPVVLLLSTGGSSATLYLGMAALLVVIGVLFFRLAEDPR